MVLHALLQHFGSDELAVLVHTEPLRQLAVPYQAVTDHLHAVLMGKVDDGIGGSEVVVVFGRMDNHALHDVLRHDGVEVLLDQLDGIRIRDFTGCDSHAHREFAFYHVFQPRRWSGRHRLLLAGASQRNHQDGSQHQFHLFHTH